MKQLVSFILVMTCSFYYSQTAANNDLQSKDPYQQKKLIAVLYKPSKATEITYETTQSESADFASDAPQSDQCLSQGIRNVRVVIPNTDCKQYAYCVYKRDGSRQLFSSYIYTCPTTSKFNPNPGFLKCTANAFTCTK